MKFIPIIAVMILAGTLMSGRIDINFEHNLHPPKSLTNPNIIITTGMFSRHTDIYIRDSITSNKDIKDMVQVFIEANQGDTVSMYLGGYGGSVESFYYLINSIQISKANVTMVVIAPVYSGHAYLALSGNNLKMLPYSSLMYHTTSAVDTDCFTKTLKYDPEELNRGVLNKHHCLADKSAGLKLFNAFLDNLPLLTPEEKLQIKQGRDVFLFPEDLKQRMK